MTEDFIEFEGERRYAPDMLHKRMLARIKQLEQNGKAAEEVDEAHIASLHARIAELEAQVLYVPVADGDYKCKCMIDWCSRRLRVAEDGQEIEVINGITNRSIALGALRICRPVAPVTKEEA